MVLFPQTGHEYVQGAFVQFINPKLLIMVGGAVVTYGTMGQIGHFQRAVFFAVVFGGMTFISVVAWAALGVSFWRFLPSRRAVLTFNGAVASLLLTSLIPILTITDFAPLVEKDGAFQLALGIALVEAGLTTPAKCRRRIPFGHE